MKVPVLEQNWRLEHATDCGFNMREEKMEKASQQRETNEADTKEGCSSEGW